MFKINDWVEVVSQSYEGLYGKVGKIVAEKCEDKTLNQEIRVNFNGYFAWIDAADCVSY